MSNKLVSWSIFIILCVIWGSSFKLMKDSTAGLSASNIAALRIFSAGLVFVPFLFFHFPKIPARKKLGELNGEIISVRSARQRAKLHKSIAIVELHNGYALDASENRNALCFINHSCNPNCYLRNINYLVEMYTRRAIKPGEELTCDYGETHHKGGMKCKCGAENCRDRV